MESTKGECKCYADLAANGKPIILKCPLCRAAPDLYEAMKLTRAFLVALKTLDPKLWNDYRVPMLETTIEQAIAKAEGK